MLFIHETFLVYKLETFTNCKEVKQIVIVIIAVIYIFFIFWEFDQQLKITFRKFSAFLEKIHLPPPFYSLPPKNSKGSSSPFLLTLKIFQASPAERGCGWHYAFFSKNGLIVPNFGLMK